jgi:hypothetical protein
MHLLASALGIPHSTLYGMKMNKDDPVIIPHSNAIRPLLTETHRLARMHFVYQRKIWNLMKFMTSSMIVYMLMKNGSSLVNLL